MSTFWTGVIAGSRASEGALLLLRVPADDARRDLLHVDRGHADLGAVGVVGAVLEAPDRRLPVGHVDAVAARVELVAQTGGVAEVQVVLLADAVLAGAVVDVVPVLDEERRALGEVVVGLDPEGDVVQAPGRALGVQDEAEVVRLLVAARKAEEPRRARLGFDAAHHAEVQDVAVPERRGLDVRGRDREVVQDAHADPVRGGALGTLGERGLLARRRDGAVDLPEELLGVTGGSGVAVRAAVAERRLDPLALHARGLDGGDGDVELLLVPGAPGAVAQPGLGAAVRTRL